MPLPFVWTAKVKARASSVDVELPSSGRIRQNPLMHYPLCKNDQGSDDDQRRDALLLRLLKTPPKSRSGLAEAVQRAKGKKPYFGVAGGSPAQESAAHKRGDLRRRIY